MTDIFSHAGQKAWEPTPDGNRRRVLVHTDELMMVEFAFEKGGVGVLHSHPHVQASYVAEGRFEVTVDGRSEILETGSSFIVPSNLVHGVKALEAGTFDLLRGKTKFRQIDHQGDVPSFIGKTAAGDKVPFKVLADVERIPADKIWPSEAEVLEARKAK